MQHELSRQMQDAMQLTQGELFRSLLLGKATEVNLTPVGQTPGGQTPGGQTPEGQIRKLVS